MRNYVILRTYYSKRQSVVLRISGQHAPAIQFSSSGLARSYNCSSSSIKQQQEQQQQLRYASTNKPRTNRHSSESAAAMRRKAVKLSFAPPSISLIGDDGYPSPNDGAFIRQVGCTRRVFILQPYFTAPEMEGLAYRIKALSSNDSINSVLIATDGTDNPQALASTMIDRDFPQVHDDDYFFEDFFPPEPSKTFHVTSGYDALRLFHSGEYKSEQTVRETLTHLSNLALAVRGDRMTTKIPIISMLHGAILDGGFALCTGSYVLATRETSYRIINPSRGLSLDPVGLSYLLPRLGHEFRQPSRKYSASCGMILALMGYEADAMDMVETGLATHYLDSPRSLALLEMTLSELPPWNQQALLKKPEQYLGRPIPTIDHNAAYRNVGVAETIQNVSSFSADSNAEFWTTSDRDHEMLDLDPTLEPNPMQLHRDRESTLVNYAATFHSIFQSELTVAGILERFREIASQKEVLSETKDFDPDEMEGIDVAVDFVSRLERQSPLAVCVVHKLLQIGRRRSETMESCIERERRVQAKMYTGEDFVDWAKYTASYANKSTEQPPFDRWKYKSFADVDPDEVIELVESE